MSGGSASNNKKKNLDVPTLVLLSLVFFTLVFVVWEVLVLEGIIVTSPAQLGLTAHKGGDGNTRSGKLFQMSAKEARLRSERFDKRDRPAMTAAIFDESQWTESNKINAELKQIEPNACGYKNGLFDLEEEELHPVAGERHMITPPQGGKLSLVCCETTKGNLAMIVHHKWAPIGAARFLDMVKDQYFDSTVPMMRCLKNFLCQFGLNSDPQKSKKYQRNIPDDPNWLPEGPTHRENDQGVKRFAQGYLAYAGAGKNSRGNQLILSLEPDGPLAGGSPWEVPWGELVGEASFETLKKFYTGYGEGGPGQGKLMNRGMTEEMKKEFPELDYINKCVLVHEREP